MCKYLSPQLTSSEAGFLGEEVLAFTLVVLVACALAVGRWGEGGGFPAPLWGAAGTVLVGSFEFPAGLHLSLFSLD